METIESPNVDATLRDEPNFIQNVSQFYNQEALSDVVLKIGDDTYFAHKFVLAKSSDVFRTMLYERNWSHGGKEQVELSETPECAAVFDKFLRYLYTAEISISTTTAVGILCLSDKYNVESLKALCVGYMVDNSRSPRVRNALNWYAWAKALHLESLIEQCTKTIAWNVHEIITSPDWLSMDIEFICDMLGSSELVIPNEYSLFEAIAQWLLNEPHIPSLQEYGQRLLPLLRFPQMLASQLYQLEQGELASRSEVRDLLHNLLSQAYRFRALCLTQGDLGVSFNEPYYMPRDYVNYTVDNVRMQNTLRFGIQVDVKMFKGPVPVENRDGDWKITYRKPQNNVWSLQLYGHDTAMVNNEARVQPTILVYDENEKVIQVERGATAVVSRGNCINMQLTIDEPSQARNMAVLLKNVPS